MAHVWSWIEIGERKQFEMLAELETKIYPADDCITADDYLVYKAAGNRVIVGCLDGAWIGNYQISVIPRDCPLKIIGTYISGLAVFKANQGRGYSRILMDHLLSAHGSSNLVARIRAANAATLKLVRSSGFEAVQPQIRDGVTWLWFHRPGTATDT